MSHGEKPQPLNFLDSLGLKLFWLLDVCDSTAVLLISLSRLDEIVPLSATTPVFPVSGCPWVTDSL